MAYNFDIYVDDDSDVENPVTPTSAFLQDVADDLCTLLEAKGFSGVFVDVTYKNEISAQSVIDVDEEDTDDD